ncbi:hypothetical protein EIP91_009851, partial [Steccherinum ochraceum]
MGCSFPSQVRDHRNNTELQAGESPKQRMARLQRRRPNDGPDAQRITNKAKLFYWEKRDYPEGYRLRMKANRNDHAQVWEDRILSVAIRIGQRRYNSFREEWDILAQGQVVTLKRNPKSGWFECPRCQIDVTRNTQRAKDHLLSKCPKRPNATPPCDTPATFQPQPPPPAPQHAELDLPPVPGPTNDASVPDPDPFSHPPVSQTPPAAIRPVQPPAPEPLPRLDISTLAVRPGASTVTSFDGVDLLKYGITVDKTLRMAVCFECHSVIFPSTKISKHEYGLRADPVFPVGRMLPVYGLPLIVDPLFFCETCFSGYSTAGALRTHRHQLSHPGRSPVVAYGQIVQTTGKRHVSLDIDLVDGTLILPDGTPAFSPAHPDADLSFKRSIAPIRAAFDLPVTQPDDDATLNFLFRNDGWVSHIAGHSPAELEDARRGHLKQPVARHPGYALELLGPLIKDHAVEFIGGAQRHIHENVSFGMTGFSGQAYVDSETTRHFNALNPASVERYGGTLYKLVFLCVRFYVTEADAWTSSFRLPLVPQTDYAETQLNGRFFSPVCSFVVLQCIRADGSQLKAGNITQIIAHLMYATRASVLLQAVLAHTANPAVSILDHVEPLDRFIRDRQQTPFSFMFNAVKYLRLLQDSESNPSDFKWSSADHDELDYHGNRVTLAAIRETITTQVEAYVRFVKQVLFFGEDTPLGMTWDSPVSDLVDDTTTTKTKFSFVDDPRNGLALHKDNPKLIWNTKALLTWLQGYEDSQLILAVLIILSASAGPSARATEFARYLLRERLGCRRNVSTTLKNVSLDSTVDKTSARRRVQHHFAEYAVEQIFPPGHAAVESYLYNLWPSVYGPLGHMDSDKLSAALADATERCTKQRFGMRLWRSLTTVIFSQFADPDLSTIQAETYYDRANMHSTSTADQYYGGNTGLAPGSSATSALGFARVSATWHKIYIMDLGQDEPILPLRPSPTPSENTVSVDGLDLQQLPFVTRDDFATSRKALLSDLKRTIEVTVTEAMWSPLPPTTDPGALLPVSDIVPHPSRLAQLRNFLQDPNGSFTHPLQAVLLEHVLDGRQNLLAVLPTSFGKTATIMLLSKCYAPTQTIVVVLPLLALHADFRDRAVQLGVACDKFNSHEEFDRHANVVTVAVEALDDPKFYSYLESLAATGHLYCVFFDEVHTLLTDVHYRNVFSRTKQLTLPGVQLIGLTATLPPHLVRPLSETIHSPFKLLRTPTVRPEHEFSKQGFTSTEQTLEALLASVRAAIPNYKAGEGGLIFCNTRKIAQLVAEHLGVLPFHAGTDREGLAAFLADKQRVLPCTSVLGAGFDRERIRHVWFYESSEDPVDFLQKAGRGGRDHLRSIIAVFYTDPSRFHQPQSALDLGSDVMRRWVTDDSQCLRRALSEFLDGQPIT